MGVTDATVRRWIKDGDLPAIKVNRVYLVSQDAFEEFKMKFAVLPAQRGEREEN